MKRLLILLIALTLIIPAFPVFATAPTITKVYADVYGVVVTYASAINSADVTSITLNEIVSGTEVTIGVPTFSENQMILKPSVETERLKRDIDYVLNVDGIKKGFKIATITDVDFDANPADLGRVTANTTYAGSVGSVVGVANSSKIVQIVESPAGNRKMFINNGGGFSPDPGAAQTDYTVTYDSEYYADATGRMTGRYYWHNTNSAGSTANSLGIYFNSKRTLVRVDIQTTSVIASRNFLNSLTWPGTTAITGFTSTSLWEPLAGAGAGNAPVRTTGFRAVGNVYSAYVGNTQYLELDKTQPTELSDKTMNSSGYFFHTNGTTSELIDNIIMTKTSEFAIVETKYTNVTDVYATAKRIELDFTGEPFTGTTVSDASKAVLTNLKTGLSETISSIELSGNKAKIFANIQCDDMYSLKILNGFGESSICTNANYEKIFIVRKIASVDFENEDVSNGVTLADNAFLGNNDELKLIRKGAFSEIVSDGTSKKLFMMGGSNLSTTMSLDNYNISFDWVGYAASTSSANSTYNKFLFRNPTLGNNIGYGVLPNNANVQPYYENKTVDSAIAYDNGLKWPATGGNQKVIDIKNGVQGAPTTFAEMGIDAGAGLAQVEFRAIGKDYSIFRNNNLLSTSTYSDAAETNGYFAITSGTGAVLIDNILITRFENATVPTTMAFAGDMDITVNDNIATGNAYIINRTAELKPYTIIIAVYSSDNSLLNISAIESGNLAVNERKTIPMTASSLAMGGTIKAFLLDGLNNIAPYCAQQTYTR